MGAHSIYSARVSLGGEEARAAEHAERDEGLPPTIAWTSTPADGGTAAGTAD